MGTNLNEIETDFVEFMAAKRNRPLKVYDNILKGMQPGGVIYGDFGDHHKNLWHISTDLSEIRNRISHDFQPLDYRCYKRVTEPKISN